MAQSCTAALGRSCTAVLGPGVAPGRIVGVELRCTAVQGRSDTDSEVLVGTLGWGRPRCTAVWEPAGIAVWGPVGTVASEPVGTAVLGLFGTAVVAPQNIAVVALSRTAVLILVRKPGEFSVSSSALEQFGTAGSAPVCRHSSGWVGTAAW